MKQYMPSGSKWEWLVKMKKKYDPKAMLALGQKIFTYPIADNLFVLPINCGK